LGAGTLAGAALCFKPTCILPLIPLLFWRKRTFKEWLFFAVGMLATPLIALLILRASGGLPAYLEIQKLLVVPYVTGVKPTFADHALGLMAHGAFWAQRLWPAAIFAALALVEREKTARRAHFFAVLCFGGGFVALWVQNRAFAYQWTPMLPAFAFLAASGSVALGEKLGFSAQKCALWCAVVPLLWGGARGFETWRDLVRFGRGDITHTQWLARFNTLDEAKSVSALPAAFETARFIRARAKKDDGLWVWAYEPEIYLETGLRPPHPFYLHQPLIVTYSPQRWRSQALLALQSAPPRFIVLATDDDNQWFGAPPGNSKSLWQKTEFFPYFSLHYDLAARFGRFETYQRKTPIPQKITAR
jgi:hypothetical protein